MLTERQKAILKAVIENYIKSAKPVSSWDLTEKRDLRVSSATIRNEFAALEETGHLFQPHTSAGRLPTEKAYRFYVEGCLKERELARSEREKVAQELFSESEKRDAILKKTAKILSHHSHGLALVGFFDSEEIYRSGLSRLFSEPEFIGTNLVFEAAEALDELDSYFDKLLDAFAESAPEIYIGSENPLGLEEFSFIGRHYRLADRDGFLALMGPTRMNYRKNISLIEYLGEILDNIEKHA
ncbi:TPA: hypothetical protein DCP81_02435 [Candidatus Azambacteria bacterium]|nr:hypothetical protein [Candidatus Azambacteria bacterium]